VGDLEFGFQPAVGAVVVPLEFLLVLLDGVFHRLDVLAPPAWVGVLAGRREQGVRLARLLVEQVREELLEPLDVLVGLGDGGVVTRGG